MLLNKKSSMTWQFFKLVVVRLACPPPLPEFPRKLVTSHPPGVDNKEFDVFPQSRATSADVCGGGWDSGRPGRFNLFLLV